MVRRKDRKALFDKKMIAAITAVSLTPEPLSIDLPTPLVNSGPSSRATSSSPPPIVLPLSLCSGNHKKYKKSKNLNNGAETLSASQREVLQEKVHNFVRSCDSELVLSGLSREERCHVHTFALRLGLKSRSHGKDGNRILTVTRHITHVEMHVKLEGPVLAVSESFSQFLSAAMPTIKRQLNQHFEIPYYKPNNMRYFNNRGLTGPRKVPPPVWRTNLNIQRERSGLPIYTHRNEILKTLDRSQVIIVKGSTGSGKSTQLPQYLLENANKYNKAVHIVVTQPRRIAAISVSSRIAQERGEKLGHTVGYQVRMNSKCSSKTILTLTTGGSVLRIMAVNAKKFFQNISHLIIDEVHERDLDTDFLLLAAKIELQRNKFFKVILMSATMDIEALSSYFNNAPIIDVEGRCFTVRIFHLEEILVKTGYMTESMKKLLDNKDNKELEELNIQLPQINYEFNTDDELEETCAFIKLNPDHEADDQQSLLAAYCQSLPADLNIVDNDLIVSLVEMLLNHGKKGSVIIYLPGYKTMNDLQERFLGILPLSTTSIIMLHSRLNNQTDDDIFVVDPNIQLKIILSTNIGQTSITIPDLIYVIDTGVVKIKRFDIGTGASQLVCSRISQADAQQRAGRAGRRHPGICYRLYPTAVFDQLEKFVVPEIKRRTLDQICLLAKLSAPDQSIAQFLGNALDTPSPECVELSCKQLKLIDVLRDSDEGVTKLGRIIALLPLDVQLGKCVVYSLYYRCFGSVSIIASFYSVRSPFIITTIRTFRQEQQIRHLRYGSDYLSDAIGVLTLYEEYTKLTDKKQGEYCKDNFLCRSSMDMFLSAVTMLREIVDRIFNAITNPFKYDDDMNMVRMALTAGIYPKLAYIDRSKKGQLISQGDPFLKFSRNSCLTVDKMSKITNDWVLYMDKTLGIESTSTIEFNTLITTLMVAIQCGKEYKLESRISDQPPAEGVQEVNLCLDNWIRISMNEELGNQLIKLRMLISREVLIMVNKCELSIHDTKGTEIVHNLLLNHSEALSLPSKINI